MIYIMKKDGGEYSVTSHHESITQDIIDQEKFGTDPFITFATASEVINNRWIEIWIKGENCVTFFNDQCIQPSHGEYNESIERAVREYLPVKRNEKLESIGI